MERNYHSTSPLLGRHLCQSHPVEGGIVKGTSHQWPGSLLYNTAFTIQANYFYHQRRKLYSCYYRLYVDIVTIALLRPCVCLQGSNNTPAAINVKQLSGASDDHNRELIFAMNQHDVIN